MSKTLEIKFETKTKAVITKALLNIFPEYKSKFENTAKEFSDEKMKVSRFLAAKVMEFPISNDDDIFLFESTRSLEIGDDQEMFGVVMTSNEMIKSGLEVVMDAMSKLLADENDLNYDEFTQLDKIFLSSLGAFVPNFEEVLNEVSKSVSDTSVIMDTDVLPESEDDSIPTYTEGYDNRITFLAHSALQSTVEEYRNAFPEISKSVKSNKEYESAVYANLKAVGISVGSQVQLIVYATMLTLDTEVSDMLLGASQTLESIPRSMVMYAYSDQVENLKSTEDLLLIMASTMFTNVVMEKGKEVFEQAIKSL